MIKAQNELEWLEILKEEINENVIKFHNVINIVLNIIIPIILLVFIKVDVLTYFVCFIVFDILQVFVDCIILFIHKNFNSLFWFLKKSAFSKEIDKLSLEEIISLKDNFDANKAFYDEKMEILRNKIEELKSFENVEELHSKNNEIAYVEEVVFKFKNFEGTKWIKDYMEIIVETSEKLMKLIKEDETNTITVINTFNIYSEELLKIISNFEKMDDVQKDKYTSKIIALLDDFCKHLTNLEERIISSKEDSIDFDIDFLQKRLKEEEEKNV